MAFENASEKKMLELSDELNDLKSERKLVELDLEKRIIVLEKNAKSLEKSIGAVKDIDVSKNVLEEIDGLKKKLRDIEDAGYVAKLEEMQAEDRLSVIDGEFKEVKEKIKLISDAIDILSESKGSETQRANSKSIEELSGLKSDIESVKAALKKIAESVSDPKRLESAEEQISRIQSDIDKINASFKGVSELVREKIGHIERKISANAQAEARPQAGFFAGSKDVLELKEELARLKNINQKIIGQLESDSKKISELKALKDERNAYESIKESVSAMEKKVLLLKREMDLDRALYPSDIQKMKNQIICLKNQISVLELDIAKNRALSSSFAKYKDDGAKKEDLLKLSGEIIQLKSKSTKNTNEALAVIGELSKKQGSFEALLNAANERIDSLASLNTLNERVSSLSAANELAKKALESKISDIEAKMGGPKGIAKEELAKISQEFARLNDKNSKSIGELVSMLGALAGKYSAIENDLNKVKEGAKSAALKSALAVKKNAPQEKPQSFGQLESEITKDTEAIAKIVDNLETFEKDKALLKGGLESLQAKNYEIKDAFESKIDALAKNSAEAMDAFSKMVESLTRENVLLRNELESLKAAVEELNHVQSKRPVIIY